MCLAFVWVLVPHLAYQVGVDSARNHVDKYLDQEKGCVVVENKRWGRCKTLLSKDGKVIYEGLLITHSNNLIAFVTKEGSFVTTFPQGGVIRNTFFEEAKISQSGKSTLQD